MTLIRKCVSIAAAVSVLTACSKSSTSPTSTTTTTTTTSPTPVIVPACATWAATQRGTGVPPATGDVLSQREDFYNAGGGIRKVNSRYYVMLFPANWTTSPTRRVFVDLHGTGGAPETEWSVDWKNIVTPRGWAYLGLKYLDDSNGSYDSEDGIYTNLKTMVDDLKANCDFGGPSVFLQGYSRGSAETFPVAYLDLKDRHLFKAFADNSGAWMLGGALTATMQGIVSRNEMTAYNGAKFWMYCGGLDMEHGYPMCDEMKNARDTIRKYGGTVARLYEDPSGGHGGLAKNAAAWMEMFSYFEGL